MAASRNVALLCLLGLVGGVRAEQGAGEVVSRVVSLVKELKAKTEQDGKDEQKLYDKYACWCEATSSRSADDIHQAMADIKSLSSKVLATKGLVATLASEISQVSKELAEGQRSQAEATGIRQKENAAYGDQKGEMETTLGSLEQAIKTLSGAGTKTALLQMGRPKDELTLLKTAADVHEAIKKMPVDHRLSAKELSVLSAFTADPATFYDKKAEKAASYNPASATIQGILKDMYDTFSANLEKATESEATQQKNFEGVVATQTKESMILQSTRTKKESEKADAEKVLADSAQDLDDTKTSMEASVALFDDTKAACTSKAAEWSERVRARTEELAGIDKALELLDNDDAKSLFNKAIKPGKEVLLQMESFKPTVQMKVFDILKKTATENKSMRFASLAATVRTAATGHFDIVIQEVDKMIANLQQEQKDDFDKKDWCKEETFKNEQEASRFEYKVEKLNGKIAKFNAHLEELETARAETLAHIRDVKSEMRAMQDAREAAHTEYKAKRADDEAAAKLLQAAIESLGAFYKNNDVETGPIQGSINLLQHRGPVFEVSKDQAPDATFTSAGKSGGEAKGILSTLTMIKEDLDDEVKNGIKDEEDSQAEFEKSMQAAETLKQDLTDKETDLKEAIASVNQEIDSHEEEKKEEQGNLEAEHEYLWSIKPDCTWVLNTFDERRKKRDIEIEGLRQSKGMLQGAMEEASAGKASLVQKKAPVFDDDAFGRIHFHSSAASA